MLAASANNLCKYPAILIILRAEQMSPLRCRNSLAWAMKRNGWLHLQIYSEQWERKLDYTAKLTGQTGKMGNQACILKGCSRWSLFFLLRKPGSVWAKDDKENKNVHCNILMTHNGQQRAALPCICRESRGWATGMQNWGPDSSPSSTLLSAANAAVSTIYSGKATTVVRESSNNSHNTSP